MSWVAASEPGGRVAIRWYITENFPQVVGKSLASIHEFIDWLGKREFDVCGKEKFCMTWNFPGFPGFGMMDNGDDWNGLIKHSNTLASKGPIYLPLSTSLWIME